MFGAKTGNLKTNSLKASSISIESHNSPVNTQENNSPKTANKTCNSEVHISNSSTNLEIAVVTFVSSVHAVAVFSILISKLIRVS